jgi:hypothetical protein
VADAVDPAPLEGHELLAWPETDPRDGKLDPDPILALVEEVLQRCPLVRVVGRMNFPEAARKTGTT